MKTSISLALVIFALVALGQVTPPPTQPATFFQAFSRTTNAAQARTLIGVNSIEQLVTNGVIPSVKIHLPRTNFALAGRQFLINWDNVVESPVPIEQLEFVVTGQPGRTFNRGFRHTATEAQSSTNAFPLRVDVYWNRALIGTKSTYLRIASTNSGAGLTRNILVIGDSITALDWTTHFTNFAAGDPLTMNLIGTMGSGANRYVGIPGWSWEDYRTNSTSPFVFNGAFNFPLYIATNGLATPDIVAFELGVNSCALVLTDAAQDVRNSNFLASATAMIANIKAAYPAIKICFLPPTPFSADQDCWGGIYGHLPRAVQSRRNRLRYLEFNLANFDVAPHGHMMANSFGQLDQLYDLPFSSYAPNDMSTELVRRCTDPIHPSTPGKMNLASAFLAWVKNNY